MQQGSRLVWNATLQWWVVLFLFLGICFVVLRSLSDALLISLAVVLELFQMSSHACAGFAASESSKATTKIDPEDEEDAGMEDA